MAYDERYRKRAVEYYKEGNSQKATMATFKIARTTLKTWVKMYDSSDKKEIKFKARKERRQLKIDLKKLEEYVIENPDKYLCEIGEEFNCSGEAVRKALKKLKISLKKRELAIASRTQKRYESMRKR